MSHPSKPFNTTLATTIKDAGRLAAGGAWPRDGPLLANARPSKLHQQGLYACVCLQGLMVSRGVHASMRTRAWSMRARSKPPCLPSPSPKVVVERTINYKCKHIEIETCGFQDLLHLQAHDEKQAFYARRRTCCASHRQTACKKMQGFFPTSRTIGEHVIALCLVLQATTAYVRQCMSPPQNNHRHEAWPSCEHWRILTAPKGDWKARNNRRTRPYAWGLGARSFGRRMLIRFLHESFNSWLWKVTSEGMTARLGACCTPSSMNEPFCVWPLVKLRDNHVLELCSEFHEKL